MGFTPAYAAEKEKQFDRFCQLVLINELKDIRKYDSYLLQHEKTFSELTPDEESQLFALDKYNLGDQIDVDEFSFEIENELLFRALEALPEKKRNIVLLSYFLDMTDKEIANRLELMRWTVSNFRTSSLKLLKQQMEDMLEKI
jgi:RNA polymerase sigma factor (sigma-70 family)